MGYPVYELVNTTSDKFKHLERRYFFVYKKSNEDGIRFYEYEPEVCAQKMRCVCHTSSIKDIKSVNSDTTSIYTLNNIYTVKLLQYVEL